MWPDENGSNLLLLFVPQILCISCLCFCLYSYNLMLCNCDVLVFCSKSVAWLPFFYFFLPLMGLRMWFSGPLVVIDTLENSRISNNYQCLSLSPLTSLPVLSDFLEKFFMPSLMTRHNSGNEIQISCLSRDASKIVWM